MSGLRLELLSTTVADAVPDVCSLVATDASGSFGLLPGHARFMTALVPGLARFRRNAADWEYLALAGGVLHLEGDTVTIATRRFLRGSDYERLADQLDEVLQEEAEERRQARDDLRELEKAMLRRLWQLRGRA